MLSLALSKLRTFANFDIFSTLILIIIDLVLEGSTLLFKILLVQGPLTRTHLKLTNLRWSENEVKLTIVTFKVALFR